MANPLKDLFSTIGRGVIDLGEGAYEAVENVIKQNNTNIIQQGLRYSDDQTTNAIINQYLSNINRGSALTKGAKQIQQTPLGKLNVPVGSVPFEEIGAEIDITTTNQTQPLPFDFQKAIDEGAKFMSIKGDRSSGTGSIVSVNEIPLIEPVKREGGYQYATELGNVQDNRMWASDPSVLSKQRRKAEEISGQKRDPKTGEIIEEGAPVYGVYFPGAGENVNFSTMVADTTLNMMPNMKITKKSIKEFDKNMKTMDPDWPGLKSTEASDIERIKEYLFAPNRGDARKAFTEELAKPRSLKLGFPDQASVRAAISVPDMLGTGSGDQAGRMITKIDYNAPFDETSRHKTYPAGLKGVEGDPVYRMADETGQFRDVPVSLFFPEFMESRKIGGVLPPEASNIRSMELRQATQPVNPEVEDIIQNYLRQTYQQSGLGCSFVSIRKLPQTNVSMA